MDCYFSCLDLLSPINEIMETYYRDLLLSHDKLCCVPENIFNPNNNVCRNRNEPEEYILLLESDEKPFVMVYVCMSMICLG